MNIYENMEVLDMVKVYKFEVDCANCANKIEDKIKKIEGVADATLNFMSGKAKIIFKENANPDEIIKKIAKEGKRIDSDFSIL